MNATHSNRLALLALTLAALLSGVTLAEEKKEGEEKTLADHMSVINDNYKVLKRSARTKEFTDDSVKLVGEMIAASQASREMAPPMAEKMAGPAREKFIEEYKKEMDGLTAELQGLEKALKEKRADDAAKSIDKLNLLKKAGHDKFVEE